MLSVCVGTWQFSHHTRPGSQAVGDHRHLRGWGRGGPVYVPGPPRSHHTRMDPCKCSLDSVCSENIVNHFAYKKLVLYSSVWLSGLWLTSNFSLSKPVYGL